MTNDQARDLAIRLTDLLVQAGIVPDCIDTDNGDEFDVQDLLHAEIARTFNVPTE